MISLNKVLLVGNLTRDPELRYTPQGTAVTTLRIAVNTPFKGRDGQAQKETCFINVVVWAQMAEVCNQYLQKGKPVMIEGRLQSRSWQDDAGKNRTVIEVKASRVQFMPQGGANHSRDNNRDVNLGDAPEEVVQLKSEKTQDISDVL